MTEKRWCFVSDDDCHSYLIPLDLKDKFNKDMEEAYSTENFSIVDWVDEYRTGCHPSCYSFISPRLEK